MIASTRGSLSLGSKTSGILKAKYYVLTALCCLALASSLAFYVHLVTRQSQMAPSEPFFDRLGSYSRKVTTRSALAQRYFDQGLAFLYGFNHDEAIRSFEAAAACDPQCAMAFWGIAMANGPHINRPSVSASRDAAAWKAFLKAFDLLGDVGPVEQALIKSLQKRYGASVPADRKPLDEAYAEAMRELWKTYPDDADVGALTAEAILDLHPWNQWTRDGQPQPGTEEVIQTLEDVLAKCPKHPFALHLLIHALEASPHPEKAAAAADILRDLLPGLGHIVHMPSHIDVRRGHWHEAVIANEKAIAADTSYQRIVAPSGYYRTYMTHNHHMLAFAAMMQGSRQKATITVHEMLDAFTDSYIAEHPELYESCSCIEYEIYMRFGRWDDMLAAKHPKESFHVSTALWHFGRGIAFAAKKQLRDANEERRMFVATMAMVPKDARFRKAAAANILSIADAMLAGEIAYRGGEPEKALTLLRDAVQHEDALRYAEPPYWLIPARHSLGATLMDAGRFHEAELVYREDLQHYPDNGWSLYGLARSLRLQHKEVEARAMSLRFTQAWRNADMPLSSSCICLPGKL